jgi:hypothetical protein
MRGAAWKSDKENDSHWRSSILEARKNCPPIKRWQGSGIRLRPQDGSPTLLPNSLAIVMC